MEIKEISKRKFNAASESEMAACKDKMDKMRKEGEKLRRGMFEFLDAQGGWLDFSYRFFPGDPIRTVRITHGEIVDIPMILVKHLNNIYKKVRTMPKELDKDKPFLEKISRTRFTPMDVM
jgi:predicted DNA-binding antitoxin AbrB/MazE fold protein